MGKLGHAEEEFGYLDRQLTTDKTHEYRYILRAGQKRRDGTMRILTWNVVRCFTYQSTLNTLTDH